MMLKLLSHLPSPPLPSFSSRRILSARMSTKPVVPKSPNFISVEGADINRRSKPDGIRFRLVSYNILAQVYVKSSIFPHSPPSCLKWKARSQAILTVLRNLGADFLCLQEVDEYDSFYKRNMEAEGYSGIYIQRSGNKRDGCAIFYKASCAELVTEERIEYNDLVDSIKDESIPISENKNGTADETKDAEKEKGKVQDRGDPNDPRVRLKRDCVGLMAAFRIKEPFHHIVIVANTHLYWDPEWADVKLAQANYLLSRLAQFKRTVSEKYECTPSLLLAGDFNSTPGDKVYQYLVSGNVSPVKTIEEEEEEEEEAPIPLCSVYGVTRGEPPFTNCTPDFTDTLDYIFLVPSDTMKPLSILELPEPESPDVTGCLPNFHHPSDHLPIGAEFEICLE